MASPSKTKSFKSAKASWAAPQLPRTPSPSTSVAQRSKSPTVSPQRPLSASQASAHTHSSVSRPSLLPPREPAAHRSAQLGSVPIFTETDVRCGVVCLNQLVWLGMRTGDIFIWKPTGELLHIIERRKGSVVLTLCEVGGLVWAGCSDGHLRALNQQTFRLEAQSAQPLANGAHIECIAYHPESRTVFTGGNDYQIIAWDISVRVVRHLSDHNGAVRALAVDGAFLYSAADDGLVICWDASSGHQVRSYAGHTKGIRALCATFNYVWSGSDDGTIRVWKKHIKECAAVIEVSKSVTVLRAIGDRVWCGAGETVSLWDANTLKPVTSQDSGQGTVSAILLVGVTPQYKIWSCGSESGIRQWFADIDPQDAGALLPFHPESDLVHHRMAHELSLTRSDLDKTLLELERAKAAAASVPLLEGRIAELQVAVDAATVARQASLAEAQEAGARAKELDDKLLLFTADNDRLMAKLRDVDCMFKSRLGLLTDVYSAFRRFETLEKRHGAEVHEMTGALRFFRSLIGAHFTDAELAHLGTSRHFFAAPQPVPGSPVPRSPSRPLDASPRPSWRSPPR